MTFLQAWGKLVLMTIVTSILSGVTWYNAGPMSAFLIAVMLVCLELIMFLFHMLNKHYNEHPLVMRFNQSADAPIVFGLIAGFGLVVLALLYSLAIEDTTWHQANGIAMLTIGQACLSETIHRLNCKNTVFHHRRLTTWIEPALYVGAIIGVAGGVWLICQ